MRRLSELNSTEARQVRYILMDIDDTLTRQGKLLASSYTALWKLQSAGFIVIPVTGRSAGWCDLIARQWPVNGVIGENGALVFWEEAKIFSADAGRSAEISPRDAGRSERLPVLKQRFHPQAVRNSDSRLQVIQKAVLHIDERLRLAKDQFSRLFDIAIDFAEEEPVLPLEKAVQVAELAKTMGARAKVSSIHVNIWMGTYDKLTMAELFLQERYGWDPVRDRHQVLFAGDSPNDEPMFAAFPVTCGVANIHKYMHLIKHLPAYVSSRDCGDGFAEIAEALLTAVGSPGSPVASAQPQAQNGTAHKGTAQSGPVG
ncbi:HAD-IIB family hydrolase [Gracilinema caldarium]|uniref:HAD-superfamily hydrolase, subfamily IIB n=1 Tax=Gracilinema caldarium (strain ATCC 51460 / DSM 7334 / H1) TaxID=744872 RepID=F8EZP2_GRAC1|nr:HAD-IIB family hydrolase [Gracilinema caldarium]AEJ20766.1 HAD-superfamily hydrolase, subfamily IIB [Gracilinema caldarium DSM 7334]